MKQSLEAILTQIVNDSFALPVAPQLSVPEEKFGDYSTNLAMQLSGQVSKNPRDIATIIADHLKGRAADLISEVQVVGPGFINIRLNDVTLMASLQQENPKTLEDKTILVEYSDPNPLKPLHAGHLYTTLVGDSIARLIQNAGATTIRINYGGDVGLHVAKSMWAILHELGGELPQKLEEIAIIERPKWLGDRYVEGNNAYEDSAAAKADITACNKQIYALHARGDKSSPFAQIYWTVRQWSYDYFQQLYDQLQVEPFDRYIPESEVTAIGEKTVQQQLQRGVFAESDGAVVYDGEVEGLHTRVFVNSAGLPTYETKDVGLSLTKWRDYHFDESIIITASEQLQYMQVVIAAISQFAHEPASRTRHITHGVVKLQGGIKMSSRKGNIITAADILESARSAGQASGTNPTEDTVLAAIKYAFAKNRIGGDIAYDPTESIALEGNSGPYLQYAHARACSILRKSEAQATVPNTLTADERSLVRQLTGYTQAVESATNELLPHYICSYLYGSAQAFNRFYENNRVIGDDRESERLWLVAQYAQRLKAGLELLGITAPEQM